MSWFRRIIQKFASLRGEYWIIDGISNYADGDVGDVNHDGVVYENIYSTIDELEVDDETKHLLDSVQLNGHMLPEEQQEEIEEKYEGLISRYGGDYHKYQNDDYARWDRVVNNHFNWVEMHEIEKYFPGYLEYTGTPKDYAVEHLGWIRVLDNNFEVEHVTEHALNEIMGHVYDQADEDDFSDIEICIDELSTGAYVCLQADELNEALQAGQGMAKFRQRQRLQDS